MKVMRLSKMDRELFAEMDPLSMMELLDLPDAFGLAAALEDEETGEDVPAGLAILRRREDSILIAWLCVGMAYRRQGIGEELLAAVFDLAVQWKLPHVCAYLNAGYGRELVCANEEGYLKDRLLEGEAEIGGEWRTTLRALKKSTLFAQARLDADKGGRDVGRAVPLLALSATERSEALLQLSKKKHTDAAYSITEYAGVLDEEVSCLLYDGGKLAGGLLVQRIERDSPQLTSGKFMVYTEPVLYPVAMSIDSTRGLRTLLYGVLRAACEKYDPETEVYVVCEKGRYAPLMEHLLPGMRIGARLFTADVDDYLNQDKVTDLLEYMILG